MKVAIIGGGPAGLATLRFLAHAHEYFPIPPIEVRLFESEAQVGGTFAYRVYEDAEVRSAPNRIITQSLTPSQLVSSKYLTAFSDFRLPKDAPDFITPAAYVKYLKDYIAHFNLGSMIECNTKVVKVRRGKNNTGHVLSLTQESGPFEWKCDAVAVCTGINVNPVMPYIEGIEQVETVLHSSRLKTRDQFGKDTNVYIMGAGETGMDLAYLAVTSAAKTVTLCHRDGFFCAPKVCSLSLPLEQPTNTIQIIPIPRVRGQSDTSTIPNKPVDTSVASLFDTAYVHPKLQNSQLLWTYYDKWIKNMHTFISGTEEGPDQWVGQMSASRKHADSSKFTSPLNGCNRLHQ